MATHWTAPVAQQQPCLRSRQAWRGRRTGPSSTTAVLPREVCAPAYGKTRKAGLAACRCCRGKTGSREGSRVLLCKVVSSARSCYPLFNPTSDRNFIFGTGFAYSFSYKSLTGSTNVEFRKYDSMVTEALSILSLFLPCENKIGYHSVDREMKK